MSFSGITSTSNTILITNPTGPTADINVNTSLSIPNITSTGALVGSGTAIFTTPTINTSLTVNGPLSIHNNAASFTPTIQSSSSTASNYTLTLPDTLPLSSGETIVCDTSGNLSFSSISGGTVTNVSSANSNISVANPTTTPTLTLSPNPSLDSVVFTNGTNTVTLEASGSAFTNYSLNLPLNNGTFGQVLINDGAGNTSWQTVSGSGVSSVGNATSDTTLTIAGTGSGPYTGTITAKVTDPLLINTLNLSGNGGFVTSHASSQSLTASVGYTWPPNLAQTGDILSCSGGGAPQPLVWTNITNAIGLGVPYSLLMTNPSTTAFVWSPQNTTWQFNTPLSGNIVLDDTTSQMLYCGATATGTNLLMPDPSGTNPLSAGYVYTLYMWTKSVSINFVPITLKNFDGSDVISGNYNGGGSVILNPGEVWNVFYRQANSSCWAFKVSSTPIVNGILSVQWYDSSNNPLLAANMGYHIDYINGIGTYEIPGLYNNAANQSYYLLQNGGSNLPADIWPSTTQTGNPVVWANTNVPIQGLCVFQDPHLTKQFSVYYGSSGTSFPINAIIPSFTISAYL